MLAIGWAWSTVPVSRSLVNWLAFVRFPTRERWFWSTMRRWAIGLCMPTRSWVSSWRMLEWILITFNHRSRVWKQVPYDYGFMRHKYDSLMRGVVLVRYWRKVYARLLVNYCSGIVRTWKESLLSIQRKPLSRKDLRRNWAAIFDVTPYATTTYDDPKGGVAKCCSKMQHL